MQIFETIRGLFSVLGGIFGTSSAFSGAWGRLFDTIATIVAFVSSFFKTSGEN